MAARYSKLAQAATVTTEEMLDAEYAVKQIKAALADGLQPHDIPEILAACAEVEQSTREIRAQMAVVADVEMDIDAARRVLNVGRGEVWDERFQARERRLRMYKAPTRLHPSEASDAA